MDKKELAKFFKDNVDWNKFYSLVDTVGTTLNSSKDRFEKSDLFEISLEIFSNNKIKYVNKQGADHEILEFKIFTEMKFSSYGLYKKSKRKGLIANPIIKSIRLVNTNGKAKPTALPSTYAPYVLLADLNGAVIIDTETLKEYLDFGEGHIEAQNIPISQFEKIVGPDDITNRKKLEDFDYKQAKIQFQLDFLNRFK
jgi:hypothetical protein